MYCSSCGKSLAPGLRFCRKCGYPVPPATQIAQPPVQPREAPGWAHVVSFLMLSTMGFCALGAGGHVLYIAFPFVHGKLYVSFIQGAGALVADGLLVLVFVGILNALRKWLLRWSARTGRAKA